MIKLLIWAGLLYAGVRFVSKALFRPFTGKSDEVGGKQKADSERIDLKDVQDVKYRDIMPDDSHGKETSHH